MLECLTEPKAKNYSQSFMKAWNQEVGGKSSRTSLVISPLLFSHLGSPGLFAPFSVFDPCFFFSVDQLYFFGMTTTNMAATKWHSSLPSSSGSLEVVPILSSW